MGEWRGAFHISIKVFFFKEEGIMSVTSCEFIR